MNLSWNYIGNVCERRKRCLFFRLEKSGNNIEHNWLLCAILSKYRKIWYHMIIVVLAEAPFRLKVSVWLLLNFATDTNKIVAKFEFVTKYEYILLLIVWSIINLNFEKFEFFFNIIEYSNLSNYTLQVS